MKGCKKFSKRKKIHNFDAFFNAESIESFVFSISYTVPEIIFKKLKKLRKNLIFNSIPFISYLFSSFFDAQEI